MNIEEYEMLLYLIEQQYDIFKVLKEYYENKELKPFGSFIQDEFGEIEMTHFMRELYKEASEKIRETLFHKN